MLVVWQDETEVKIDKQLWERVTLKGKDIGLKEIEE